ncbi:MAG: TonB-dependent receptor [Ginsengibacter sp.]
MKEKTLLVFVLVSLFFTPLFSQTIRGRVIDERNQKPIVGATIRFSGKGGTTTDDNGFFYINCNTTSEITVSHVGYSSAKQRVKNCVDEINVSLEPNNVKLDEVEITATSAENKSLLYQPTAITKIGEREIKRGTGLYLDDAINGNVPGVTLERRAVSSGQHFNIRGYGNGVRGTNGLNSNFDGQGYKLYLNNIPITDAEGITQLDDIDFGSIGNVEVVKGPSGTLYGLAISGVVNLKTMEPEKGKVSVGQDVQIGNYGLQRYTTHFEMGREHSSLLVNYGHQRSDGYFLHNSSRKDFVNVAGNFHLNKKQTINTFFSHSNSYDERAGELTIDQYKNKDYSGNPFYIKNNAHSEVISFRAGLSHTYNFSDAVSNTTTIFGYGATTNASSAGGWTDKQPANYGLRSTLDAKFPIGEGISLSGITGIEAQQQRAQTIGYGMVADSSNLSGYNIIGPIKSNQFTTSSTSSLFTEWTLSVPHDISFTAGIGMSKMRIELNDRLFVPNSYKPSKYSKLYDGMVSPHFAINKVFNRQFSVYASYSKAYKAPVSSYFFIPSTGELNTGLKPETGNQYEIGTKGALLNNRLTYQVALFRALFSNKMYAVAVPLNSTTTAYSYIANGGKQDDKGIEVLVKFSVYESQSGFLAFVRPFVNFTYSDFKYVDYQFQKLNNPPTMVTTTDYSGKAIAGVSPVTANAGVDIYSNTGLYFNLIYMYKDALPITSDGINKTDPYSLVNSKIGYQHRLSDHFDIDVFFGINNITGTHHPISVFINQLPDAYTPAPYNADYFGGINLRYIF